MDWLGHFLRHTPSFRGRGRLTNYWVARSRLAGSREQQLPGGSIVRCDLSVPYEAMVWLGQEEPDDLAMLQQLLKRGQTFVDCGANIGIWSLVAAKALGPGGRVFSFEPNPHTHRRLMQHIERNDLGRMVTVMNACCGSQTGEMVFACEAQHNCWHVVTEAEANTVLVPVTTLDAVLSNELVHGIKIDVEGQELPVLQGAKSLLLRCRPWICVEFNTLLAGTRRLGDWDVHQYLGACGYRCRHFLQATEAVELSEDWQGAGYCNLFYSSHPF